MHCFISNTEMTKKRWVNLFVERKKKKKKKIMNSIWNFESCRKIEFHLVLNLPVRKFHGLWKSLSDTRPLQEKDNGQK